MTENTRVFRINKWRGINENADGDTKLKYGEAAELRNFRITRDGNLQIRPGTHTTARRSKSDTAGGDSRDAGS